jgi:hypothetical protein
MVVRGWEVESETSHEKRTSETICLQQALWRMPTVLRGQLLCHHIYTVLL